MHVSQGYLAIVFQLFIPNTTVIKVYEKDQATDKLK